MPLLRRHAPVLSVLCASLLLLTACNDNKDASPATGSTGTEKFYQTKTPYQPQQDINSYEKAPAGFSPVFTELVARHGSRGLSSLKYDLALYNLWQKAKQEGALTTLGEQLGPDLEKMMTANILLGYGVEGISKFGYGNETQTGIREHQGIADRLLARQSALFNQATSKQQSVQVLSSGVDRAVDSAKFFSNELIKQLPALKALLTPQSYTSLSKDSAPSIADGGVNRFQLYFHSLNADEDEVPASTDANFAIYQASQNYQDFEENNTSLQTKLAALSNNPQAQKIASSVLSPLFKDAFIAKLGQAGYTFTNTGSFSATAKDGAKVTVEGKGKNTIAHAVDAAAYLYELYSIGGGMATELGADYHFEKYMPASAAKFYAEYNDANDFYEKGSSFSEAGNITYAMAQGLKQDFFKQVDAVVDGSQHNVAVLRFSHAEIIIPLATSFELKGMMQPLSLAQTYSYSNSTWRGVDISPMAANMQWDIYKNAQGQVLVKMLYNEKENLFKPACDGARYQASSYFYDYQKLKACYSIN